MLETRESNKSDEVEIKGIHIAAFRQEEGRVVADLANNLLSDKTAMPLLSLVAAENNQLVGHILYIKEVLNQPEHWRE